MPSYDYNFDNSPRDDDEKSNIPNETSDYGVSPLENLNLGVGNVVEKCASGALHVAGKVAGAGFHVAGKIFRGLFG